MCKQCGGGSICDHGRQRQLCKECGGASICSHGRRRSQCKDCGYSPKKCEHGKVLSQCKICRPPKAPKEKGEVSLMLAFVLGWWQENGHLGVWRPRLGVGVVEVACRKCHERVRDLLSELPASPSLAPSHIPSFPPSLPI